MSKFTDQSLQDQKAGEADPLSTDAPSTKTPEPFAVLEDGRVLQTKEDAIKALTHARQHITTLEQENAQYKSKKADEERAALQSDIAKEVLDTVRKEASRKADLTDQASKAELNKDELRALIREEYAAEQTATKQNMNYKSCLQNAKEVFGDSIDDKIGARAAELNMSMDEVVSMAKRSPTAFSELFIPKTKQQQSSFAASADVTTAALKSAKQGESSLSLVGRTSKVAGDAIIKALDSAGLYNTKD